MTIIISLIIALITAYAVYWCFENYGFKLALLVTIIINIIESIIKDGFSMFWLVLILSIIIGVLDTLINYFIYKKTNSFGSYLILSIVLGFALQIIISIIWGAIVMSLLL